jgi:hypothetical protein
MRFRKVIVRLTLCFLGLLLLTAVTSAVGDAGASSPVMKGAVPERTALSLTSIFGNMHIVVEGTGVRAKVRALVPEAEPAMLVLFGAMLIGAARMARRSPSA